MGPKEVKGKVRENRQTAKERTKGPSERDGYSYDYALLHGSHTQWNGTPFSRDNRPIARLVATIPLRPSLFLCLSTRLLGRVTGRLRSVRLLDSPLLYSLLQLTQARMLRHPQILDGLSVRSFAETALLTMKGRSVFNRTLALVYSDFPDQS